MKSNREKSPEYELLEVFLLKDDAKTFIDDIKLGYDLDVYEVNDNFAYITSETSLVNDFTCFVVLLQPYYFGELISFLSLNYKCRIAFDPAPFETYINPHFHISHDSSEYRDPNSFTDDELPF